MITLTYTVKIRNGVNENQKNFEKILNEVLNHKNGIKKLYSGGVKFKRVSGDKDANFYLYLVPNEEVSRVCGMEGLSCADLGTNCIYFNYDMWNGGATVFRDGLKGNKNGWLKKYRYYLITHEMMHLLGFVHPDSREDFSGRTASVMCQQTINLQGGTSYWLPVASDKKYFKPSRVLIRN